MPFIIDIKRAPSALDSSIIHDRAQLGRDLLAYPSRECREPFPVKIRFETMPDRFVKNDAGPPRTQNHRHRTGGRLDCPELNDGLTSRLARKERRGAHSKNSNPARPPPPVVPI